MRCFSLSSIAITAFFFFVLYGYSATIEEIRYVPIGDSYTIGEGVPTEKSWPVVLTQHLRERGIKIKLLANPARTGWTTQEAINYELPVLEKLNPDFSTLLIGVNDWVQGIDSETFRERLKILLDRILAVLPQKNRLLIVTIPDFSVTPIGEKFGSQEDISSGIWELNNIIKEEARSRQLMVVDIFPMSREMQNDPSLIAPDGLHPSAKEYELWEKLIFPAALQILSTSKTQ